MKAARFFAFLFFLASLIPPGLQAGTSDWVNKTVQATQAVARGDTPGAVYSALPSANLPAGTGNFNLGANGVNYYQPLIPHRNVGPLGYGAGYNAGTQVRFNGRPRFSNSIGGGAGSGPLNANANYSKDI